MQGLEHLQAGKLFGLCTGTSHVVGQGPQHHLHMHVPRSESGQGGVHRRAWRADGRGDLYRRAETALRAAAAAALQRPTLALGPREAAEAEAAAVFCTRLAALVRPPGAISAAALQSFRLSFSKQ